MSPIITAQQAVLEGDTLVMLVKHQKVHLGMAQPQPLLRARMILCGLQIAGVEVLGAVDEDDLALLQDFTICSACSSAFVSELRQGMVSRVRASQLATQPLPSPERLVFEANQLPLF